MWLPVQATSCPSESRWGLVPEADSRAHTGPENGLTLGGPGVCIGQAFPVTWMHSDFGTVEWGSVLVWGQPDIEGALAGGMVTLSPGERVSSQPHR